MAKVTPFDVDSQTAAKDVVGFANQVKKAFIDLAQILINLSPLDNFCGFVYEGTIPAGTEVKVKSRTTKVPQGYVVTFCKGGSVQAGDTAWTKDYVYLKNAGASPITVKVFFFA